MSQSKSFPPSEKTYIKKVMKKVLLNRVRQNAPQQQPQPNTSSQQTVGRINISRILYTLG